MTPVGGGTRLCHLWVLRTGDPSPTKVTLGPPSLSPHCPQGLCVPSELLSQSVLLSHRATCHPRVEELQGQRWVTFTRQEIEAYQSQVRPGDTAVPKVTLLSPG